MRNPFAPPRRLIAPPRKKRKRAGRGIKSWRKKPSRVRKPRAQLWWRLNSARSGRRVWRVNLKVAPLALKKPCALPPSKRCKSARWCKPCLIAWSVNALRWRRPVTALMRSVLRPMRRSVAPMNNELWRKKRRVERMLNVWPLSRHSRAPMLLLRASVNLWKMLRSSASLLWKPCAVRMNCWSPQRLQPMRPASRARNLAKP